MSRVLFVWNSYNRVKRGALHHYVGGHILTNNGLQGVFCGLFGMLSTNCGSSVRPASMKKEVDRVVSNCEHALRAGTGTEEMALALKSVRKSSKSTLSTNLAKLCGLCQQPQFFIQMNSVAYHMALHHVDKIMVLSDKPPSLSWRGAFLHGLKTPSGTSTTKTARW